MTPSHAASRDTKSRRKRWILWIPLALLAVVIAGVGWVGVRGALAKSELESAIPLASRIQSQVVAGNGAGAEQTFKALSGHSFRAAELTSDPVWRLFESLPVVGPNLTAVR